MRAHTLSDLRRILSEGTGNYPADVEHRDLLAKESVACTLTTPDGSERALNQIKGTAMFCLA